MEIVVVAASIALVQTCTGGLLPKRQLQERFDQFMRGQWTQLLITSRQHRRQHTQTDTIDRRAERAEALVHLRELSSGRHALEGAPLAPENEETRRALTVALPCCEHHCRKICSVFSQSPVCT